MKNQVSRCSWAPGLAGALALASVLGLVSCGGGGGSSTSQPPTPVAPSITAQPQNASVTLGSAASFQVTATGTPTPTYQWSRSNDQGTTWAALSGATSNSYTLTTTVLADQNAQFVVQVSNSAGNVTSSAATLTLNIPPTITAQPQNASVSLGSGASFQVTATGTPAPSYQWSRSNDLGHTWTALSGATTNSYALASTATSDQNAQFQVVVTNAASSVTSTAATLTLTATLGSTSTVSQQPPSSAPLGITVGPDGNLWFTNSKAGQICVLDTLTHQTLVAATLSNPACMPVGITSGPDGNLWFTEQAGGKVGVISTAGTVHNEFPVGNGPTGIVAGPDGNLWYTLQTDNQIGQITPAGVNTVFPVTTASASPTGITRTPAGNLWFTEMTAAQIATITTVGAVTEWIVPTPSGGVTPAPQGIISTPDGSIWFADTANNVISKFSPAAQPARVKGKGLEPLVSGPATLVSLVSFPLGAGANPSCLTTDAQGNVWVANQGTGTVSVITPATPAGTTPTTYPLATTTGQPAGIIVGPDGNLYITQSAANNVVEVVAAAPAASVSVSVEPATVSLSEGGSQIFTATVLGAPDAGVTWSVQEGASGGTVTPAGVYTAPNASGTFHVVATSVADTTMSATATVTVSTMTVTGTIMVNYLPYNAMTQTITPDLLPRAGVLGIAAITGGTTYPGSFNATTGAYAIPSVPVGFYTLVMTANRTFTFYTNQPNVALNYDQQGRSTVSYPSVTTDVIFNTTNMTAWTVNDYSYLTFFDPNAYLYCYPDGDCYAGYPSVGDTALSGLGVDWNANGLPLVDTTQGDAPILEEMVDTTPAGPSHLVTAQNLYYPSPLTIVNSAGATIGGSFSPEAQTATVTVNYLRSQFAAYRSDFNAGATHRSPHFGVDDSPGLATYDQGDSNSMDRLFFVDPTTTVDVNLGSVPMPPVLPGFQRDYYAGQHSYMNYQLPGNAAIQYTEHSIYALSQTPPASGSPIAPVVSHPRNLAIGATNMLSGAGILATGVGTTPTFTWQAPTLGTPQGYKVDVYHVYASGGQTYLSGSKLRMFTTATQVQCPPNVLVSGDDYIFEVMAIFDPTYTPLTTPFNFFMLPYAFARNISGIFAP